MADLSDMIAAAEFVDRLETEDDGLCVLRFKFKERDCWALWSADDKSRQVILRAEKPTGQVTIHQLGHRPYRSAWGYRDWVGRRSEFAADRLSLVVGPRPWLMGGDLTGVSVAQTISR